MNEHLWSNPQNESIDLGGQIPELRRGPGGAVRCVDWRPCSRRWIARRLQGSRGKGRHVDFGGAAQQGALRERQRQPMAAALAKSGRDKSAHSGQTGNVHEEI